MLLNQLFQVQDSQIKNNSINNSPLVSVLVVNYNNRSLLQKCLSSLFEQDYKNIEVIVVDNNSKDDSVSFIKNHFPNVKLVPNKENSFFAKGNNIAYKESKGEIIFLLNNDAYVEKDTIKKVVQYFIENNNVGIIQNLILKDSPEKIIDSAGSMFSFTGFLVHNYHHSKIDSKLESRKVFSGKGASLFIRREIIEKLGQIFDPTFVIYFEDSDLCWKSNIMGFETIFLSDAITYHKEGSSSSKKDLGFIDFHSFKNRISSTITNLSFIYLIIILPIHIFICIVLIVLFSPKNFHISKAIIKAIYWNFINTKQILAKRSQVQKLRKVSDTSLFKNIIIFPTPSYILSFLGFYINRKT